MAGSVLRTCTFAATAKAFAQLTVAARSLQNWLLLPHFAVRRRRAILQVLCRHL